MNLVDFHRLAARLQQRKLGRLSRAVSAAQFLVFNSVVPATVQIGEGTRFAYGGIGVVIHGKAVIGRHCTIGQGVTIGGRSKHPEVPRIGDHVYIGAGARILGPVTVGDNVIIAPNCVVIEDVPANCIVVGVPARIVKEGIRIEDFI